MNSAEVNALFEYAKLTVEDYVGKKMAKPPAEGRAVRRVEPDYQALAKGIKDNGDKGVYP